MVSGAQSSRKHQLHISNPLAWVSGSSESLRISMAKMPMISEIEKLISINSNARQILSPVDIVGKDLLLSYKIKEKTTIDRMTQIGQDRYSLTGSLPITIIAHAAVMEAMSRGRNKWMLSII